MTFKKSVFDYYENKYPEFSAFQRYFGPLKRSDSNENEAVIVNENEAVIL